MWIYPLVNQRLDPENTPFLVVETSLNQALSARVELLLEGQIKFAQLILWGCNGNTMGLIEND